VTGHHPVRDPTVFSTLRFTNLLNIKWINTLTVTAPYWVVCLILAILLFWYWQTPAPVIKQTVKSLEFVSHDGFDFILAVLTANAVLIILVAAISILFKDSLINFANIENVEEELNKTVMEIVSKYSLPEHKEKKYPEIFFAVSLDDFKSLEHPNRSLHHFSQREQQISYALIFLSASWALIDFPLRVIPRTCTLWCQYRLIIGLILVALLIMTISVFGFFFIILKYLRYKIAKCLRWTNVRNQYLKFV
jgi:hypothetical protein